MTISIMYDNSVHEILTRHLFVRYPWFYIDKQCLNILYAVGFVFH